SDEIILYCGDHDVRPSRVRSRRDAADDDRRAGERQGRRRAGGGGWEPDQNSRREALPPGWETPRAGGSDRADRHVAPVQDSGGRQSRPLQIDDSHRWKGCEVYRAARESHRRVTAPSPAWYRGKHAFLATVAINR